MRIYRDATIEDLKGLADQIERFGKGCSPSTRALLTEAKKFLLEGKLSNASKLYKKVSNVSGVSGVSGVKVLADGLIKRLSEFKASQPAKSYGVLAGEYHNQLLEKHRVQLEKLSEIITSSKEFVSADKAYFKAKTLLDWIKGEVLRKYSELSGVNHGFSRVDSIDYRKTLNSELLKNSCHLQLFCCKNFQKTLL